MSHILEYGTLIFVLHSNPASIQKAGRIIPKPKSHQYSQKILVPFSLALQGFKTLEGGVLNFNIIYKPNSF